MVSSKSGKFVTLMENKIEDQKIDVERHFTKIKSQELSSQSEADLARLFYWDGRPQSECGTAINVSDASFAFPLLPQLLVTPCLIVDIIPLPVDEFTRRYGVTPDQMIELTKQGFVIPNIYHYLAGGWKHYAKYRSLWPILEHPKTRINTLWIGAYFDRRHRFTDIKNDSTDFFRKEISKIRSGEANRIVKASHQDITLELIPEICGLRLAYLRTIGQSIDGCVDIAQNIQEKWETRGKRHDAVSLLDATQGLVVSTLSSAYGGRSHLTRPQYNQIADFFGHPLVVSPSDHPKNLFAKAQARYNLLPEAEFCLSIVNKIHDLRIIPPCHNLAHPIPDDIFPLDDDQFKEFLKTLNRESIRRGNLGQWADGLTDYLRDQGKRPDPAEYWDLLQEIDTNLRPIPYIPQFLEAISRVAWLSRDFNGATPPSAGSIALQVAFNYAGYGAMCLASHLRESVHVKLLGCSVPRPLCEQWKNIRYHDRPVA